MSYYYSYYIGYKDPVTNKYYPLGPYDSSHHIRPVVERSRSFASDLHYEFNSIDETNISEELKKDFGYEDYNGNFICDVKVLPLSNLPKGSYIKTGYYLIEDVEQYLKSNDSEDLFYDYMDPIVYAEKARNERIFGKPDPIIDDEGEELPVHSCSDYMYFAYENTLCKEWESDIIRTVASILHNYKTEYNNLVVLMTEG